VLDSAVVRYSYTGHETFPFRYSWPTKGVRSLERDPDLFTRDDAIVVLGIGKNMVASIRHWCDTLGLIERATAAGQMRPTPFGRALLGSPGGWDPYLEDPGTLWLLHWQLVTRRDRASTWYLAFTKWNTEAFSREKLVDWLWRTARDNPSSSATINSIQRDVDVFVRSYVPPAKRDVPSEDTFDCPLVELALLREVEHGLYQFVRGPKPTLPQDIFLFALLDYWHKYAPNQHTLSFETILHGPGSPGAAFKLSENALAERLEALPSWSHLQYDETAGMRQVLRHEAQPGPEPFDVLEGYYAATLATVGAHNA
jgi:hypothetical protein